ncbi:MAG: hypothetical protein LBN94_02565 [Puniceicoccales bacterium]|jgi:hypothetical protein|nr:hypothetical protein [Puniceicoccales bacterium]
MKWQNGLWTCIIPFFSAGMLLGKPSFFPKSLAPDLPKTDVSTIPVPPREIAEITKPIPPAKNWSENDIKNLLKNTSAVNVCADFSLVIKEDLERMEDHIEWIRDLFLEIQGKVNIISPDVKTQLTLLGKDIELMISYYKDCFDELEHRQSQSGSIYVGCIEHLKKLQSAVQHLRHSTDNVLDIVRLLAVKNENTPTYQGLKSSKREIKVMDDHCIAISAIIDQIFARLLPLLRVYHERSFEERGRGQYVQPARHAL